MGLTWMLVVIVGCVGLAGCIVAVLARPMADERRRLRPLANVGRLTRLPEYVRAVRARTRAAIVTIVLLVVMLGAAIVVGARPTGLSTAATRYAAGDPEDIMLCIGGPTTEPAVSATLNHFAGQVGGFGTQRIGLTSPNRRVIPLTRNYQYAKQTLSDYARPADERGDVAAFAAPVTYSDYTGDPLDTLALCLTGFPDFDRGAAQRRSVIYVGPDPPRPPDARGPALFTADAVRDLAVTAGVQVNTVITGTDSGALSSMSRDTGGLSFPAGPNPKPSLNEIRDHPPAARFTDGDGERGRPPESPDVPVLIALAAAVALAGWPMVQRR